MGFGFIVKRDQLQISGLLPNCHEGKRRILSNWWDLVLQSNWRYLQAKFPSSVCRVFTRSPCTISPVSILYTSKILQALVTITNSPRGFRMQMLLKLDSPFFRNATLSKLVPNETISETSVCPRHFSYFPLRILPMLWSVRKLESHIQAGPTFL